MTQLDKIEGMISQHIETSNKQHTEMSVSLARVEEKLSAQKERIDKHGKSIESLKTFRNINIAGVLGALGAWFK